MARPRTWLIRIAIAGVLLSALAFLALVGGHWVRLRSTVCKVTPLMFHAVRPNAAPVGRYWMSEAEFTRQMEALHQAGAVSVDVDSLPQWLSRPARPCPFPEKAVLITFDLDGVSDHVSTVLPVLERLGFRAAFYVPLIALDHGNGVTSTAVATLAAHGMTIGSHTEYHYDMRYEQPDSMVSSLLRTRVRLAGLSHQPVLTVSAPGGRYNGRVARGVARAGFTTFLTSDPCYIVPSSASRPLCRIEIRGDELGLNSLTAMTDPWRVALQATDWSIKRHIESLVGRRVWGLLHFLRSKAGGPGD